MRAADGSTSRPSDARIAPLEPGAQIEVAAVLAAAFHDDPMMIYLLPGPERRARALPRYFRSVLRLAALRGRVLVSRAQTGAATGAVVAMPPRTYPLALLPQLRELRTIVASGARAAVRNFRDVPVVDRARPDHPYWYVMFLGVAPRDQRGGLGGQLLGRVTAVADREALPTYLVTMNPANPSWYGRHGFGVHDELLMGRRGPRTWALLRPPKVVGNDELTLGS